MNQTYNCTIRILMISLILLHYFKGNAQNQRNTQPNIIFIFADDLGWGDLSCYGNTDIKTPSLDKMAKEGTLFTQFYVAGSVCSPSRAGIMTGQYPARNRIFGHLATEEINKRREMPNALNPDMFTITDMLKTKGYVTAHFGKWHLGNVSPEAYGVDVYRTDNAFVNTGDETGLKIWTPESRPTCTREILDETLQFIDKHKEKPFYANVWFSDVHGTLNPSKEQMKRVTNESKWNQPIEGVPYSGVEHVYWAALLEMDKQIGIFMDKIDSLGLSENTLIIFSSDNGPEDYQINNARHSGVGKTGPFRGRKRSIYEGGIRVPFIVRWPANIPQNSVNDQSVVSGVDFLPTIAKIAGAELPDGIQLDGEDMSKAWLGSCERRSNTLYWEWRYEIRGHVVNHSPMIAVREGDYKLLINPDGSRPELFHIVNDPSELMNLYREEPEIVKSLTEKALTWFGGLPESPWHETAGTNTWKIPEK